MIYLTKAPTCLSGALQTHNGGGVVFSFRAAVWYIILRAHGKEAKLPFRRVADAPEPSVIGRRSAITLNQDLKI